MANPRAHSAHTARITTLLALCCLAATPGAALASVDPTDPTRVGLTRNAGAPSGDEAQGRVASGDRPRVDLALFDGIGLSEEMLDRIRAEVARILAGADVGTGWVDRLKHPARRADHPEIKVILIDRPPSRWGLGERVMGTVLGGGLPLGTVYVFYPSVLRTLDRYDLDARASGRTADLGKASPRVAVALARVLVHEVVHVLAPGRPHASDGLMQARLDIYDLIGPEVGIDPGFHHGFRAGLVAAIRAHQRRVAGSDDGGPARDGGPSRDGDSFRDQGPSRDGDSSRDEGPSRDGRTLPDGGRRPEDGSG